jgi:ribosome-binding factor A
MALDKRARAEMRAMCGDLHDDDGIDPRLFFDKRNRNRKTNPKTEQLCRQAAETLCQLFDGELGDERLAVLRVDSVQPAPDASRLLVTLSANCAPDEFDRAAIEDRLRAATGRLRSAVAGAITRRKAPGLVFVVVGPFDPNNRGEKGASYDRA